mmetsp:Transcript_475/g.1218  ORF Transcript_475/g.1218 Transcript_475/m.1218 type:complete len:205 (-) Transcript_475:1134-1748(-)
MQGTCRALLVRTEGCGRKRSSHSASSRRAKLARELVLESQVVGTHRRPCRPDRSFKVRGRHDGCTKRRGRDVHEAHPLGATLIWLARAPRAIPLLLEASGLLQLAHRLHERIAHENGEIGTGEAFGAARNRGQIAAGQCVRCAAESDEQKRLACRFVGQRNIDTPLKAPSHRGVEPPRDVGRTQDEHPFWSCRHAHEQLILQTS